MDPPEAHNATVDAYRHMLALNIPATWHILSNQKTDKDTVALELWVFWFDGKHTQVIEADAHLKRLRGKTHAPYTLKPGLTQAQQRPKAGPSIGAKSHSRTACRRPRRPNRVSTAPPQTALRWCQEHSTSSLSSRSETWSSGPWCTNDTPLLWASSLCFQRRTRTAATSWETKQPTAAPCLSGTRCWRACTMCTLLPPTWCSSQTPGACGFGPCRQRISTRATWKVSFATEANVLGCPKLNVLKRKD